jgi:hypothetical protein
MEPNEQGAINPIQLKSVLRTLSQHVQSMPQQRKVSFGY